MSLYEITFLTKEETDPGVRSLIEQAGGQITQESSLGRRRLAYPINKLDQAVYTTYSFDIEKPVLAELNRKLGLHTEVIRFLITVKPTERVDKEMSKTVREAIAAAEKLDDTPASEPIVKTEKLEENLSPVEPELTLESTESEVSEPVEVETVKKPRAKKATGKPEHADAAEATEEDRLKALDDKLSDILKD